MFSREKQFFLIIAFLCLNASFSCKNRHQQVLFENKIDKNSFVKETPTPINYLISPEDVLQIRNLQNNDNFVNEIITNTNPDTETDTKTERQTYRVEADSTIALPMLGRVKIAGLTRTEALRLIEKLYSKELKAPIIELKIINLKVTVLGEVKNQGIYMLTKDYTPLVEIIGAAGGFNDKANSKNIKIIRGNMQSPQVFELDLSDINSLSDPRAILQNNDIIYIAQNKKAIQSQRLQSTTAFLQPVISLLNTALIIYTLSR